MPRVPSAAAAFVGERIRTARLRSSMTHDKLGGLTGIDSANIRAYETGRAMPSIHTIVRIADALRVKPGYFLDGLTADLFEDAVASRRAG
ncbi:helix-turn-helix domain-containing protein [Microbacterium sp.]|uniref:helix-turn-helix domain-containing protein n=1 Tax=Microbacterium sp. TaxID=51671 RepID=UPI0039E5556F